MSIITSRNDYDAGFYVDGEGIDGSGDDDSEDAKDFYLRSLGIDTDKYIGEDNERD